MDSEPDIARDAGPMNVREALAALDFHASKAAKRGDYGCQADLSSVREVLEDLQDRVERVIGQIVRMQDDVSEAQRNVRASIESLSRLP